MSIFIDTGAFVAYRNKKDRYHEKADRLIRETLKGKYGQIYTSDYIYDESVTLALVRTDNINVVMDVSDTILSPRIEMVFVDNYFFDKTRETFVRYHNKKISFTDAASLTIVNELKIDNLLSFDSHFDGLVQRIG